MYVYSKWSVYFNYISTSDDNFQLPRARTAVYCWKSKLMSLWTKLCSFHAILVVLNVITSFLNYFSLNQDCKGCARKLLYRIKILKYSNLSPLHHHSYSAQVPSTNDWANFSEFLIFSQIQYVIAILNFSIKMHSNKYKHA